MTNKPQIFKLLLIGKMGTGKRTVSQYLQDEYHALAFSRTDMMKRVCHALIDQAGDLDALLQRLYPNDAVTVEQLRHELLVYAAHYIPEAGRPNALYQEVTDIVQSHNALVYEIELDKRISSLHPISPIRFYLIDDVHTPQSFQYFTDKGYQSLRIHADRQVRQVRLVQRDGSLPRNTVLEHETEIALDQVQTDFTIVHNSQEVQDLYAPLNHLMKKLGVPQYEQA